MEESKMRPGFSSRLCHILAEEPACLGLQPGVRDLKSPYLIEWLILVKGSLEVPKTLLVL